MALLKADNLVYTYPGRSFPALAGVSLSLDEGCFAILAGPSGSGKSTLLRALAGLVPAHYGGVFGGRVLLNGIDLRDLPRNEVVSAVGFVFQDPERQLVMTTVERELRFGPENLGLTSAVISRRVAETADFFGLTAFLESSTAVLPGGMKQKLALASVMAMQPRVLLLDEPTSQLDPSAAEEFFGLIRRLNEELGVTVILAEHRLDRCYPLADRVIVMDGGRIVADEAPREAVRRTLSLGLPCLPSVTRWLGWADPDQPPLTALEGRKVLHRLWRDAPQHLEPDRGVSDDAPAARAVNIHHAYPDGTRAIYGLSVDVPEGRLTAVIGPNGAGKSTLLKLLAGLLKPSSGRITVGGRPVTGTGLAAGVAYLAQNPNNYLFRETVKDELAFTLRVLGRSGPVQQTIEAFGLTGVAGVNPRDLSAGERQRTAIASLVVADPSLLLLDEPSRGVDQPAKDELGRILSVLCDAGKSVVLVTHDLDFVAQWASGVVFVAGGKVVASGSVEEIFRDSYFFRPQIARLFDGIPDAPRFADGIRWLRERRDASCSGC